MNDLLLPAVRKGASTPTVDTDPYYNLVSLHLKGDVNTGRNYNAFSDASSNNFRLTNNGDVRGSSFSPYGTSWSNYFSANTSELSFASNAAFNLSGVSWTIEFWVYPTENAPARDRNWITRRQASGGYTSSYQIYCGSGANTLKFLVTGQTVVTSTSSLTPNQWNHVAVVWNGTALYFYINGVQDATTGTYGAGTGADAEPLRIGRLATNDNVLSYMSNVRVVKGVAVYTGNFTVPSTPLAITQSSGTNISAITGTQTSLLTCQTNRFVDVTANAFVPTVGTGTSVSPFSPFLETDTTTGSGYFDGTGDYLSGNTNLWATTTSTFTVDGWVYPTSVPGAKNMLLGDFSPTGATLYFAIYINSSRQVVLEWYDGTTKNCTSTSTINLNEWSYVAVRVSSNAIAMYVNSATASGLTGTTTLTNRSGTTNWALGQYANQYNWNGYISNIRMSTVARTIAIPTAPFTPDADTKLLTLQERGAYNTIGFEDDSENDFPITRSGNVAQGTFSPFSNAGWSNYFSSANISCPNINFSTNAFCIEGWFYFTDVTTQNINLWGASNGGGSVPKINLVATYQYNSNLLTFDPGSFGTNILSASMSFINNNAWNHIAIVREGTGTNQTKMYINGTARSTGTLSGNLSTITGTFNIAYIGEAFGTKFPGWISNFRIVNGSPVYTADFTPSTTPLTAITNTVLLTCQANRFVDSNTQVAAKTITLTGTPTVVPFSPFRGPVYDPVLHGGSAYFDGTADVLTVPDNTLFDLAATNFVIEAWAYSQSSTNFKMVVGQWNSGSISYTLRQNAGKWVFTYTTSTATTTEVSLTAASAQQLNSWAHLVVIRTGTALSLYVNGTREATATLAAGLIINNNTGAFSVGGGGTGSDLWVGYIGPVRLVRGNPTGYDATLTTVAVPTGPLVASPNTVFQLNFTNGGVIDSTGENVIETVGNAGVVTTTIKKYGSGSLFFDGTGDYLAVPDSRSFDFGSSDWTIEFWIYRTATAVQTLITKRTSNASAGIPNIFANASNKIVVECSGQTALTPTGTISNNTWTHVAIERYGSGANNVKIYFDGVADATSVSWTAMTSNTSPLYIGSDTNGNAYTGHLDDIRITRGLARYKGNFTPPTKALPDRGTTDQASYELGAPSNVEALVVGGGGGGASRYGGGGGAGGFREFVGGNAFSVAAATNYPISVGNGGAGTTDTFAVYYGAKGGDSRFAALVASGGGGGGGQTNYSTLTSADMAGGSGGGSSWGGSPATGGAGTAGQGNNGGSTASASQFVSAGGGGAGAPGSAATTSASAGGIGLQSSITGVPTYYAGGGGGGAFQGSGVGGAGGAGGLGGGGAGWGSSAGSAGTANTGGGGGGGSGTGGGGNGGSGVVILAYPTSFRPLKASLGLVYTIDTVTRPGYRVYRFTAGSGTISW